ncbi:hypothetical protein DY000_02007478 [Brassica cretica]|uniref:Uncharacterized protein n=1 Tax=Brassica cretica TaxID=69181 RepID=A0ABQ7CBP4_BRACR|nr:hypothetical protein DY000_02007478 [Brassica cretica]
MAGHPSRAIERGVHCHSLLCLKNPIKHLFNLALLSRQRWLLLVGTFKPPERLFSDLLHYADDPPGHAGLHCCPEQVSKAQPLLAVQYRSMSEMECRSTSGEGYRSMEVLCCRSTGGERELVDGTGVWVDGG